MASGWYTRGSYQFASGGSYWGIANLFWVLVRSGYTFSAAHNWYADLTNEVTGGGYAPQAVTGISVVESDDDVEAQLFATAPTFPTLTTTGIKAMVSLRWTGAMATSPLLFYVEFAALLDRTAADLVTTMPANGWASLRMTS